MSDLMLPPDLRTRAAPHVLRTTVLGIPVDFTTNERIVLEAAAAVFDVRHDTQTHVDVAVVRIIVDDDGAPSHDSPIVHGLSIDALTVTGGGCTGTTLVSQREACAWVHRDVLRDMSVFRSEVLEALTWALVTRLDRQPLHAAAICRNGAALLLHGRSGAGKSTLTLAAALAGFHAAADGMVFLQSRPRVRLWTAPGLVHVLPAGAASLGIDPAHAQVRRRGGLTKVGVHVPVPPECAFDHCGICFLGAKRSQVRVSRLTAEEARTLLELRAEPGFDVFADSITPVMAHLLRRGAWLLEPSAAPADAVSLLAAMLDDVLPLAERSA